MTPKEQYEARKAARHARANSPSGPRINSDLEVADMMDRLATAFERIADALEARTPPTKGETP